MVMGGSGFFLATKVLDLIEFSGLRRSLGYGKRAFLD